MDFTDAITCHLCYWPNIRVAPIIFLQILSEKQKKNKKYGHFKILARISNIFILKAKILSNFISYYGLRSITDNEAVLNID